ncbi:MAG TPA: TetR family transcriptional regulator [Mycobacteriales bacterium]|jgi:AcrR family transcriptional regulator|nr:TetR family transcriptional regulator [Mycobacteriales bacterium]
MSTGEDRPPTRKERQQQTRRALLDAARKVVAERGILGATHAEIASAAGVTVGAIYSNFASKADLMVHMLEDAEREGTVFAADAPTVRECVADLGRRLVEQSDTEPELTVLSLEFVLQAIRDPETRSRRLPERQRRHREHAQVLEAIAARSGETLPMPALDLVEVITDLSWSLLCTRAMLGPGVITESLVLAALDRCVAS